LGDVQWGHLMTHVLNELDLFVHCYMANWFQLGKKGLQVAGETIPVQFP